MELPPPPRPTEAPLHLKQEADTAARKQASREGGFKRQEVR